MCLCTQTYRNKHSTQDLLGVPQSAQIVFPRVVRMVCKHAWSTLDIFCTRTPWQPLHQGWANYFSNVIDYSETCEIRTPLGQAKSVSNWEVSSFNRAICTENSSLGPDEVSLFPRMSSFRRVAIHRFHSNLCNWLFSDPIFLKLSIISWLHCKKKSTTL
jgi:hypothetical protein